MSKPIKAIIVGAGHRALIYASYALENPDKLQIVGVADLIENRRKKVQELYNISDDMMFKSAEELAKKGKLADVVINGTMDNQHVDTTIPLLKAGYDILLEKPFAVNEEEMWKLSKIAKEYGRTVCICHVLRFAPFYSEIKQRILNNQIGDIINIQLTEHVNYHHLAVSYVRGKWCNEEECGTTMLMAKCCHDMDIMVWLMNHTKPQYISSFGSDFQFDKSKKPKHSGKRCMDDCEIEEDCLYSAKKHYIDHPDRWGFYVWDVLEDSGQHPTIENKIKSIKEDNRHGRCCWDCNHTVVDHQSVLVEFENGATGTLNMIGGTSKEDRTIHIIGTTGEIEGVLGESQYIVRKIDPRPGHEYIEEKYTLDVDGDASGMNGTHGGGDLRLVDDFVHLILGETPSISTTSLDDSVMGHYCVFKADEARVNHKVVVLDNN